VPTSIQAGYASGILLISPLGDLVQRRQFILCLVLFSSALTVGLALTQDPFVFTALSFFLGGASVTPQILLPLAADLAPPEKQASAVSCVFAGLTLGTLIARVISGIISQYLTWREVYYFSIGVQTMVIGVCYFFIPNYPAKNVGHTYADVLWSMGKYAFTEPVLVQTCIVNCAASALFYSFWVTLTFLLSGAPYYFSTYVRVIRYPRE
ncbi:hypothetical protein MPER_05001, partial [Moniliophthora perniciosa FA553]